MTSRQLDVWMPVYAALGVAAGSIGAIGTYEWATSLPDASKYVVIGITAMPLVAGLFPAMGKKLWGEAIPLSLLFWLIGIASLFFMGSTTYERVFAAKEGARQAERAISSRYFRAKEEHDIAKPAFETAKANLVKAQAAVVKGKTCEDVRDCREKAGLLNQAGTRFAEADKALFEADKAQRASSSWKTPDWLLGLIWELVAFSCIWAAFSKSWLVPGKAVVAAVYNIPTESSRDGVLKAGRRLLGMGRSKNPEAAELLQARMAKD